MVGDVVVAHGQDLGASGVAASLVVVVVAAATVIGAYTGRRATRRAIVLVSAASGVLLVVALAHVLPDALQQAREPELPWWSVPLVCVGTYAAFGAGLRTSCPCHQGQLRGAGTVAAVAAHRAIEGAAIAVSSPAVLLALVTHAAAEGAAVGAVLGPGRRRLLGWTSVVGASSAVGLLLTRTALPAAAVPLLLGVVAGVLTRAGGVALTAAIRDRRVGDGADRTIVAVALLAAAVTGAAVAAPG